MMNLLSVIVVLTIFGYSVGSSSNSSSSDVIVERQVTLCTNQGLCFNQGVCYIVSGSARCVCPEGYSGSLCETFVGTTTTVPTTTTTTTRNVCSPNPCFNGATCVASSTGSFLGCFCRTGYIGVYCQTLQTTTTTTTTTPARGCAASNPCRNGATCVNDNNGNFLGCFCTSGFIGLFCDTSVQSTCTSTSCLNDAICVPYSTSERWCNPSQVGRTCCQCRPGFTGLRCETDIDECSSNPCKNNGVCDNLINSYRCRCPTGFSGVNCEISTTTTANGCASRPCGTFPCLESPNFPNGYVCQCGINDFRPNCSAVATTTITTTTTTTTRPTAQLCSEQTVCRNQGVCYVISGTLRCVCPEGYTGVLCETRS